MGYCAEPTPEMGDFSVETRHESFWLRGRVWGAHQQKFDKGSIELAYEDIPKIRAALDQVERIRNGARV